MVSPHPQPHLHNPSRPRTTKPRGVCKYYLTPRGCFSGRKCKFLHSTADDAGAVTPYDANKRCVYFDRGYCKRGSSCWFLHVKPGRPAGEEEEEEEQMCSICLEKPHTFGLLAGCTHAFCLDCIRQWRSPFDKGPDASAMNIKSCPLCRAPSAFVTPTSILPSTSTAPAPISIASTSTLTSADGKGAEDTKSDEHPTTRYLASTRRVLCKHFVSTSDKPDGPCCPFGDDCLYHHPSSSGERHVFGGGVRKYMPIFRARTRGSRPNHDRDPISMRTLIDSVLADRNIPEARHISDTLMAMASMWGFGPSPPSPAGPAHSDAGLEGAEDDILLHMALQNSLREYEIERARAQAMGQQEREEEERDGMPALEPIAGVARSAPIPIPGRARGGDVDDMPALEPIIAPPTSAPIRNFDYLRVGRSSGPTSGIVIVVSDDDDDGIPDLQTASESSDDEGPDLMASSESSDEDVPPPRMGGFFQNEISDAGANGGQEEDEESPSLEGVEFLGMMRMGMGGFGGFLDMVAALSEEGELGGDEDEGPPASEPIPNSGAGSGDEDAPPALEPLTLGISVLSPAVDTPTSLSPLAPAVINASVPAPDSTAVDVDGAATAPFPDPASSFLTRGAISEAEIVRPVSAPPSSQPSTASPSLLQPFGLGRAPGTEPDPPFLTDGRGRVVWSRDSAGNPRRRKGRAGPVASSPAGHVPQSTGTGSSADASVGGAR